MSEPTLYNALKDIADAIRAKGVTGTMSALEMPTKIGAIQTEKYGIPIDGFVGDVDENGNLLRTAAGGDTFSFRSSDIVSIPSGYFQSAFRGRNVLDITLPNMTTIGTYTFEWVAALSPTLSSVSMPELSDIPDFGLQYAFRGCSALQSVDLDAAQTVGESGLQGCCYNDTALVTFNAPSISSVGQGGMYRCFSGCTSLEEVSLSSLTSAGNQGLDECFMGCTSLKKVQMPLSNAGTNALRNTFNGCSALEEVDFSEATSVPTLSNVNCFANTNETFRIVVPDSLYSQWIAASGWSEQGVVEHIMGATEAETLTFTAAQAGSTVAMNAVGSAPSISLEYSTDGGDTWNDFTVGSTTITLDNVGDKANIRAKTPNSVMATGENVRNTFSMTGQVTVSGNLAAILNKDVEQGKVLDSTTNQHLRGLFRGCANLVGSAKNLVIPFETLYNDSLDQTFRECSRMTEAPELPFTTAGNASCFQMFFGCTSLETPPSTLRPDGIGLNTYRAMFAFCTSLTSAPVINATTSGQQSFMEMFNGCSSLEDAPDILVSSLIGLEPARRMFQNSGIRKLVFPNLVQIGSGSSNYAYPLGQMCYGCPNLEEVYMPNLTTVTNNQTAYDMFNNCPSLKLVDWRNLSSVASNTNNLGVCFYRTPSLQILDLHLSQAPFVLTTGTTTFRGTNPHAKILVPTGQLSAWKATSGWDNRNVVQHLTPYHDELTLSATDGNLTISYTKGENETQTYLYSLDGGSSWTEWAAGYEVVVEDGSEMKVIGFNDNGPDEMNFHIQGTGCVVSGNIMSLVRGMNENGDDMAERYGYHILDEIPHDGETIGSFKGLFKNCTAITDAKNLELPATHLVSDMYEEMFMGCSNLVNGPFIPKTASPDAGGYYVRMFSGCSSLQWVGLGMDTIPSAPFSDWLDNAGTGDIWFVGDSSYVPSGWTQTGMKSIIEMNGADEICDTHAFSDFLNFHIRLGIGGNAQGHVLFGNMGNNDNSDFRLFTLTDGRMFFDLGNDRLQGTSWDVNEPWYEVELDNFSIKWKKPSDSTWSQLTGTTKTSINWKTDATLNIGQYNQNSQDVRCHYLRIYDGQTLKCDFVPCEDLNGLPAIYDKVSGSWSYSNQNNSYVY